MDLRFYDLPPEILIDIASLYLDFIDIYSLQRTCRTVLRVIQSSLQLRYKLELQIAGMLDNPLCEQPTSTRLDMLRARERAWAFFEYPFLSTPQLPRRPSGLYDVTPSVCLLGKADDDSTTRSIQAVRLPHQANIIKKWDIIHFDAEIIDFGTSIEENDLIASVCLTPIRDFPNMSRLCIILRRYSTQALYDGIASPIILLSEEPVNRRHPIVRIEIFGANLAVIVMFMDVMSDALMYVFNWRTGSRTEKLDPIPVTYPRLVFLREDILLNPQLAPDSLNIYHIPSSSSERVHLVQRLKFPQFNPGFGISVIACRGDPSPTTNGLFPQNTPHHGPYTNNPEEAVIVFTLTVTGRDDDSDDDDDADEDDDDGDDDNEDDDDEDNQRASYFVMVVHRKSLLNLLPAHFDTTSPSRAVPWESWGPPITRWHGVHRHSISFVTISAGQRLVEFRSSRGGREDECNDDIHILDFNPCHVRLAQAHGDAQSKKAMTTVIGGGSPPRSTTHPLSGSSTEKNPAATSDTTSYLGNVRRENPENVYPRGKVFVNDVVSRLPYVRCTSTERWAAYDPMLIDEERLIGTR
ncbi:hypothetical protein GALMADRAFT_232875 [Galerina marginata CBS 339.88]|uniref:F-box domain-containing protein n=1 Tax=Galerina marginata (strain CBS 339.88) TaxID=685588 RepID=A0A067S4N7_GALM3|nr:hypothetical protein GALMADRAFT_232875 [Galerina marginata CBS 339.88]